MTRRGPAPVVRHSVAPDPDPEKVRAALAFWRQALARRMAEHPVPPAGANGDPVEGAE